MKRRSDTIFWLALQRIFFGQPIVAKLLLDVCGSPSQIFDSPHPFPPPQGGRVGEGVTSVFDLIKKFDQWNQCEKDIIYYEKEGIEIITLADARYPALLKEIADPPILIMAKGDIGILNRPCISIVGARKATSHGKEVAFEIARGLAEKGFTVVSGMAYGIDAAAHCGALEAGKTIAVWGSGIDRCYPPTFYDLSQKIARSGLIISEFPLGTPPNQWNFPQRNRIISGLSLGTVIVEAASKSGSLITASFALEQGRSVFAVPGLAGGAMSQGNNMLLRNGATFVENADDVIASIAPQLT